ncbi:MAG: hypothetical protein KBD90_05695 [Alphaproteobacteria bacterium]|nr:hypothetical protein [Alphaproteobacteria bacterium]
MKWTGFVLGGLLLLPQQGTAELRPLQDRGQQRMNNVATERPGTETRYVPTGREPTNEREPFFAGSAPQELMERIAFLEKRIQELQRNTPVLEGRIQELERSAPITKEGNLQILTRSGVRLESFGGNVVVQVPETLTFKAKRVIMPQEER